MDCWRETRVRVPARGAGEVRVWMADAEGGGAPTGVTTVVMMHGAGLTAKSFHVMGALLVRSARVRAVAFDARGHGATTIEPEDDLGLATLVDDADAVVDAAGVAGDVVLLGHSMGGAVATRLAQRWAAASAEPARASRRLCGLVVLDAVEGLALAALEAGKRVVEARPASFESPEAAVAWSLACGPLRGHVSAAVSVPDQLVREDAGAHGAARWRWRTDLAASSRFWEGWFAGLSGAFLAVPRCPKLLLLAGLENLDAPLTAGHMQGKYQLVVLSAVQAGHFVHEDAPGQTAAVIAEFVRRLAAPGAAAPSGMTAEQALAYARSLKAGAAGRGVAGASRNLSSARSAAPSTDSSSAQSAGPG